MNVVSLDKTSLSIVENTDVYEVQKEYRTRDTGEISLGWNRNPKKEISDSHACRWSLTKDKIFMSTEFIS